MIDVNHCNEAAQQLSERNDCSVRACAVAAQVEYSAMHEWLAHNGREPGDGMHTEQIIEALRSLGFALEMLEKPKYERVYHEGWNRWGEFYSKYTWRVKEPSKDYQARTVTTLQRELTTGTYLVFVRGHVLCLRDGVVHDWADGRRNRIMSVYKVTE